MTLQPIFTYTRNQFLSLEYATIIASSISLTFSALIIIVYIYMLIYHRKEANRVSLRCVFLCCLSNTLTAILNIVITSARGDTKFCRAAGVLIEFSSVFSTSLLTLVGINLILIFVLNVNGRDQLERFYYPAAFVYAIISITMPVYNQATADAKSYSKLTCWYLRYIEDRTYSTFAWMWFYAFIFFANLVAIVCSIIATSKLIREQRVLAVSMQYINKNSVVKSNPSFRDNSFKKKLTRVLTKVVLRCIAYPLVPFLVNIFGFILQMLITTTRSTPSFALAMLNIVFGCLEGVFVAFVFFTDPVITSFLRTTYSGWYTKYVEEYTLVPKDSYETLQSNKKMSANDGSSNSSVTSQVEIPFNTTNNTIEQLLKHQTAHRIPQTPSNTSKRKTTPVRKLRLLHDDYFGSSHRSHINSMAMAAIIPPSATMSRNHSRLQYQQYQESPISTGSNDIYIPYRYPMIATCIHYTLLSLTRLRHFFTRKPQPNHLLPITNTNRYKAEQRRERRYSLMHDNQQDSDGTLCKQTNIAVPSTGAAEDEHTNTHNQTPVDIPLSVHDNIHTSALLHTININNDRNDDDLSLINSIVESIQLDFIDISHRNNNTNDNTSHTTKVLFGVK